MPYNIQLTDKCEKSSLDDDYEEYREHGEITPLEDEMLRYFLEAAYKNGLVKSFSKIIPETLEA